MRLTSKDIKGLIQIEINWCLDNPSKDLNHDQQMGFVNGLRQAQTLIERFESIPDESGRYAPPMKYWQHGETGRVCASVIQPSEQWGEISKGQYEMHAGATKS